MHTTSGMRTVQELKNIANSISIMNAQLIEDTASITMEEMSTWFVSGESNPEPNATVASRVVLRGIPNAYAMRNGWIWYSPMDSYSTERVELLRGPNAFLYGEADVGGAQNQITKRGLFTRNVTRAKIMFGSDNFLRGELDLNRRLVKDKLAVRFAAVQSKNDSWLDHVRRDYRGMYAAVTYRPFRSTTITLMGEHAKTTSVNSQGLFVDAYSRAATAAVPAAGGFVYIPASGLMYRAQGTGRVISTGNGTTIVDPTIVPREFHANGPHATYKNYYDSITLEAEHHIGKNLHLQITGNFYQQQIDNWAVVGRTVLRDRNANLPNGQPNPYFNELYQEYFRTRNINGNIVRDMRFSAVYDVNLSWMKQQLMLNLQQHQDTPGQKKPKWGEYLDASNPAWTGVINPAITQAAFTANRTVFTSNRFLRRYYLKDGATGSEDLGPVPGLSAWYPDLSNAIAATGQFINRRFYTPSWGVGASGTYFKDHLFTHVGYRQDHFNMKTTVGAVRPLKNEWIVDEIPGAFAPNPAFVHYEVDGANYGVVLRLNEMFAIGYNYAQSFRISVGEGNPSFNVGERQGIPVGEGQDISARFSFFKGRLELSAVRYDNFTPNARFNPAPVVAIRDEVTAIFPTTFNATGQDYQTTTTSGYELEAVANLTRNWRLMFNVATNKVVNEDRAPLLKAFQAEAKAMNQPTPLLDAFMETIPEGLPNPGYTKARFNIFSRYTISEGILKGAYIGGGMNYRERTYRGTADLDGIAATPVVNLWSPAYSLFSLLAGYRANVFKRPTTFAVNVSNVLDQEYYRSGGIASGSWGDPRSFRFTVIMDF
jgi:outer membrane receptor protein involved in Fe transport